MSPRKPTKKADSSKTAADTLVKAVKTAKKKTTRAKKAPKAIAGTAAEFSPESTSETPAATVKPYVVIDFPVDEEIVSGLHYAIRIGSADNGNVQIQFNGGEWIPCRATAGYWWYDWGYFTPGAYKIVARLIDAEGRQVKKSAATKVQVV